MKLYMTVLISLMLVTIPPAAAGEVTGDATFGWLAAGSTFMLGENHPYFVGQFSGTQMTADPQSPLNHASIQCPGYNDIGVGAAGYCTITDAEGDTAYLAFSCTAIAPIKGTLTGCAGTGTFNGGTGKYAKATGGDKFTAYTTAIFADGHAAGYSLFTEFNLKY